MSWLNFISSTTPPVDATKDDTYRLALAKALMSQGMEQPETRKAGRFAVPTSPWETLAKLGQSAAAAYMIKGQ